MTNTNLFGERPKTKARFFVAAKLREGVYENTGADEGFADKQAAEDEKTRIFCGKNRPASWHSLQLVRGKTFEEAAKNKADAALLAKIKRLAY